MDKVFAIPLPGFVDWLLAYLGKYAAQVLGSYMASLILLVAIIWLSLWRAARTKRALAQAEARAGGRI
jgi:heme exporter protein D